MKNWLAERKQTSVVYLEGKCSEPVNVESGVTQGSVLVQGMFLYYRTSLISRLRLRMRLFSDNTIVYLTVVLHKDIEILQDFISKFSASEDQWLIKFHAKSMWNEQFVPGLTSLASVKSAKYGRTLELLLMTFIGTNTVIKIICVKANLTTRFLKRNLNIGASSIINDLSLSLFGARLQVLYPHT